MAVFDDLYYWSSDGLRLHARDYAPAPAPEDPSVAGARPVILCLHGLTRNARDFEALAPFLSGLGYRVLAVEQRGRGESAYATDPLTYTPLVYVRDCEELIHQQSLERVLIIGTSLGGLMAMLMGPLLAGRLTGVVLNDIGPVVAPAGLEKIKSYVGRIGPWPTWMSLARHLQTQFADTYPAFSLQDWLDFSKRLAEVQPNGRIMLDYDPRIAEPFKLPSGETGVADLWPAFEALAPVPLLTIRGLQSDILSADVFAEMQRRRPDMQTLEVANVGHAPTLDEPECRAAIASFVGQAAHRQQDNP